jgi:hypothetical protein
MKSVFSLALVATAAAVSAPALADFDTLKAQIAHTHAIAERARSAAHEALADKYRAEQRANDARCARIGGAKVGMNAAAIQKSCWGRPLRVNITTTADGTREQWIYGGGYLYLTDGVVTAIQTSK